MNISASIIRTLAFNAAWGYAPTRLQLLTYLDIKDMENIFEASEVFSALNKLIDQDIVVEIQNRVALKKYSDQILRGKENELFFPRKIRRARKAASFISKLPWVRAVVLCNTTALGQARDSSDLDFFIIVKSGTIWRSRFFAALPFMLLKARPLSMDRENKKNDPVCLSFFITDDNLDLSKLALPDDDPYLRYWFLTLMPLMEDGVLDLLWQENKFLRRRHPFASRWISLYGQNFPTDVKLKQSIQNSWLESFLKRLQLKRFPKEIKLLSNKDTRVVVNNNILKFHVQDQREKYKNSYQAICREYGVEP